MENVFNLTESWKSAYREYLLAEEEKLNNEIDSLFEEIEQSQKEAEKGFNHIQTYFSLYALSEAETWGEGDGPVGEVPTGNNKDIAKDVKKTMDTLQYVLNMSSLDGEERQAPSYRPALGIEVVERIGDMKFPKNIIFFIKQLSAWVVRVVLFFYEKFKNILRRLVGIAPKELNVDALKLKLEKVKDLETTMISLDGNQAGKPVKVFKIPEGKLEPYVALKESLNEGLLDDIANKFKVTKATVENDNPKKQTPIVVSLDLSQDILNLQQLVQHFYDLFDNSYGSNAEHLFKTDDLELLLQLFKRAIENIKTGSVDAYQLGTELVELNAVSPGRIYENLKNTYANVNELKLAYQETFNRINKIAKIINNKELTMVSSMGVDYKFLTSSTMHQMINILKTIKPRLKEADKLESKLSKAEDKYKKIVKELESLQRAFVAVGNVTYTSVYQKKINELFNASKYMTQTISLRLTAIALYIKQLKDLKEILVMLSAINAKRK